MKLIASCCAPISTTDSGVCTYPDNRRSINSSIISLPIPISGVPLSRSSRRRLICFGSRRCAIETLGQFVDCLGLIALHYNLCLLQLNQRVHFRKKLVDSTVDSTVDYAG